MPAVALRARLAAVLLLVAALTPAFPLIAGAGSSEEQRLAETRAKIDAVRAEIRTAQGEQSRNASALADAERRLGVVMDALAAAEQAVQRQQQAVDAARTKLGDLEANEARQRRIMTGRAVSLYKQGTASELASILASASAEDALRRTALLEAVNRSDQRSIEQVTISQTAVDAQREQLQREEESLERVADTQREIVAVAEELRADRALRLASSNQRVAQLQDEETVLEAESQELAALARRAEREAAAARAAQVSAATATVSATSSPSVSSGSDTGGEVAGVTHKAVGGGWTWPASGPVTSEFGYRWGRPHEGVDIGAPEGSPIWAAAAGTVSYAGSMSGYGNIVLVDHGGGVVTAYAHQSSILVGPGTPVSAGQQIGRVGSTGRSTGPHLHFEVRVGGGPRNPRGYLP